ncbi:hypothetical protein [Thermosipho melanesiensis]|nr:hypothetical protein [Thermosipho melanesiensis]
MKTKFVDLHIYYFFSNFSFNTKNLLMLIQTLHDKEFIHMKIF